MVENRSKIDSKIRTAEAQPKYLVAKILWTDLELDLDLEKMNGFGNNNVDILYIPTVQR